MPDETGRDRGKDYAQEQLKHRRANRPKQIDNASLHAGSSMYFYCATCGALSDVLPEGYLGRPKKTCEECAALKEAGWLE